MNVPFWNLFTFGSGTNLLNVYRTTIAHAVDLQGKNKAISS